MNNSVGSNYRKIYFDAHPQRYHNCKICGTRLDKEISGEVTVDHIVPQNLNGTNALSNLQVLCRSCNSKKSDKINALTMKYSGNALIREIKRKFR
ncbi:HNH endonuclease [Halanaerobium praevalens]|uniref:HNH endonuclease n=1 Tax=Halanaerobium praevalens (strain ATCC 33744 / DSM 2228 / GSL) TaxID=572479 RepID=E3DRT8_HALPG|nr:HNH endonuclease signature motif containing protein [Halanaerobium praevalens]ADO78152.1 HNH endonuclease [Halanaerobium praevalens DSM 2228]